MSQEIINKKNIEGLHQNQKILQSKLEVAEVKIGGLNNTIMQLQQQIQEMQQKQNIFLSQNRSRGRTT
ncbi:MAG: hypothetical protein GQ570_11840 [Helicobacteraceae bacterium]|nr:hypothetical protein [Helicobacteraceae bacterium]